MTKPTNEELWDRYRHHAPPSKEVSDAHELVRMVLCKAACDLNKLLPDSRYTSLFHTAMEQAKTWANTAIAIDGLDGGK